MKDILQGMLEIIVSIFKDWQSIVIIFLFCAVFLGFAGLVFHLLDRKNREYRKTINVGDKVNYATQRYLEGEIIEIDGNDVTVKTKIHKNEIYTPRK